MEAVLIHAFQCIPLDSSNVGLIALIKADRLEDILMGRILYYKYVSIDDTLVSPPNYHLFI